MIDVDLKKYLEEAQKEIFRLKADNERIKKQTMKLSMFFLQMKRVFNELNEDIFK